MNQVSDSKPIRWLSGVYPATSGYAPDLHRIGSRFQGVRNTPTDNRIGNAVSVGSDARRGCQSVGRPTPSCTSLVAPYSAQHRGRQRCRSRCGNEPPTILCRAGRVSRQVWKSRCVIAVAFSATWRHQSFTPPPHPKAVIRYRCRATRPRPVAEPLVAWHTDPECPQRRRTLSAAANCRFDAGTPTVAL